MPTEILAVGDTAADSADVTVAAGESLTVCLKGSGETTPLINALVHIALKDDDDNYTRIDTLTHDSPALVIAAAGTYRFTRRLGVSCGVFSG